jgi:hypothetical protein
MTPAITSLACGDNGGCAIVLADSSRGSEASAVRQKMIYSEVQAGRLRTARVGGGRNLRLRAEWIDEWLQNGARQK